MKSTRSFRCSAWRASFNVRALPPADCQPHYFAIQLKRACAFSGRLKIGDTQALRAPILYGVMTKTRDAIQAAMPIEITAHICGVSEIW